MMQCDNKNGDLIEIGKEIFCECDSVSQFIVALKHFSIHTFH